MSEIAFKNKHQPYLKPGEYTIGVRSSLKFGDEAYEFTTDKNGQPLNFYIAGERFTLNPKLIHSVFPPKGNLGEHSNVLPHIILNRSTLPWEREAIENNNKIPWLALLLFEEGEAPEILTLTLDELLVESGSKFPKLDLERGQSGKDSLNAIDIKRNLLETQKIMPLPHELDMLAHVRQEDDGDELAVIVCNRLPRQNGKSVVHLVSLEKRLAVATNREGFIFDYQGAQQQEEIRLISLFSWEFSCVTPAHSFNQLLKNLDTAPFRLPPNSNSEAERNLARGAKLLPHKLRSGERTYSWYQGPLSRGARITNIDNAYFSLPVRSADELQLYNPEYGIFDISYAAAWEIGRGLALQDKDLALNLYRWKRSYAQFLKQQQQEAEANVNLPEHEEAKAPPLPPEVKKWFGKLQLLENVPFHYLVCDQAFLPPESLRFFRLDALWIDCLLDGAYSIGRITDQDLAEEKIGAENPSLPVNQDISGILLRSEVVSGWPALMTKAYSEPNPKAGAKPLTLLRQVRLAENILFCLYAGEIKCLDIHQKPEALHYGLDWNGVAPPFSKELRNNAGTIEIPWRNEARQILDIKSLAERIESKANSGGDPFTSADFSLEMVEGTERVRYKINENGGGAR